MQLPIGILGGLLLLVGAVLAIGTTTDNRIRWAVQAPLVFGTGALLISLAMRTWGGIAVTAGMYFYAALNYRNSRTGRWKADA